MFQAILVEDNVGNTNMNVVRKFLWGPQGQQVDGGVLPNSTTDFAVDYDMNITVSNSDNLYVIAFVQDKNTKRILQSVIVKAPSLPGVIVGIPEDPKANSLRDLIVYPNPSFGVLKLKMDEVLPYDYTWNIIDQRGVTVQEGGVNRDLRTPQEIDVSLLPAGIYFMQIQTDHKALFYKKIAIIK